MNARVSSWMDDDLSMFRDSVARFVGAEMLPHEEQWRKQQHVGKYFTRAVAENDRCGAERQGAIRI